MYLFLDIDGVLNTMQSYDAWHPERINETGISLDPESVRNFNRILNLHHFDIVISSSWRHTLGLEAIRSIFYRNGITVLPVDATPEIPDADRGMEILEWFRANGESQSEKFLVIDDNSMDIEPYIQPDCFLHVENGWITGLTQTHVEMVVRKIENFKAPVVA